MFFRVVNFLMAINFFFSAALQYNDPDPKRWVAIYGLAGLISAAAAWSPTGYRWYVSGLVFLAALLWALTIEPHVAGRFRLGELFQSWEMHDQRIEQARETIGLLIVAVWMLVLTIVRWRRGKVPPAAEPAAP